MKYNYKWIKKYFLRQLFQRILIMVCLSFIVSLILHYTRNNNPSYAVYNRGFDLSHVKNVLDRMGFRKVDFEDDWDLLWSHVDPFNNDNKYRFQKLNPYQKINHFPGIGYLTSKVELCTSGLNYLPKSFRLPKQKEEFLNYAKSNPNLVFIVKNNTHRNIIIKPADKINLNSETTFVQEYFEDPYLVDGFKFDIGIYVIITSINPLRIYIYIGDYAFRFCPEEYYPFDPTNVNKYVVADNYRPMWEVPSLKTYYNVFKFNFKDSFDAYVRKQKQDPNIIWNQMEEIIRYIILQKENDIIADTSNYNRENFFELMRFDFIVNKDLKVYLIEANMSPNLSSGHFPQNAIYFEQIIYNAMELVGIGSSIVRGNFGKQLYEIELMISSEKNVAVNANECLENLCEFDCSKAACNLCLNCINANDLEILHKSYREHIHRASTKRIFPKPITNLSEFKLEDELKDLNPSNQMITRWFYEKCKVDSTWCS